MIALTYGPEADWVRNVLASGGGTLETQGRALRLTRPRLFHDERRRAMPWLVRLMLGVGNVSDFLALSLDDDTAQGAGATLAATTQDIR